MTAQEHEDGMRQEPTLSAAEKAAGFAAVMKRLKNHSPDERAWLQAQADEVVLGHEAYALGQEYLDRGDYEAARRWLRIAAGHHIPGATQALEELGLRQTLDGFTHLTAVGGDHAAADTMHCGTIPSPHAVHMVDGNHRSKGDQPWDSVMEHLYAGMAAAARAQAVEITEQARRDADDILAEARQQAERTAAACAEMVLDTEQDRKEAAELLAEARQVAESTRSVAVIAEGARRRADGMLATARGQALLILDDARSEAAEIRSKARRQGSVPNRGGTKAGVRLFRELWGACEQCTNGSGEDPVGPVWDASGGPAQRLPVTARSWQVALERLLQVPLSFTLSVVLIEGEAYSTIRRWVWAPQERDEQGGAGLKTTGDAWQVLEVGAGTCDATLSAFERTNRACSDTTRAARQGGLRVLAMGVLGADCEDADETAPPSSSPRERR
ncbi:hypothetical protein ACFU93_35365 [Streptomyces sp. NPDC057611]|uniref:hypothetical protein n=1 Tax=Streptomyces sp. NPDC057611 TaxID=3346182 RepID=UPI0036BABCD9